MEDDYKLILERLVEELQLNSVLTQYLHTDKEQHLDLVVQHLHVRTNPITTANIFWKQLGDAIRNDPELVLLVVHHQLLLKPSQYKPETEVIGGRLILERLVEELQLNCVLTRYLNIDKENHLDRELRRLFARDKPITEMNIFWKTFGAIINNDLRFILLVQKSLLSFETAYKKRFADILVDDLQVTHLWGQCIWKRDEPLHIMGTMTINPLDEEYCEK
eukprot:786472_1